MVSTFLLILIENTMKVILVNFSEVDTILKLGFFKSENQTHRNPP